MHFTRGLRGPAPSLPGPFGLGERPDRGALGEGQEPRAVDRNGDGERGGRLGGLRDARLGRLGGRGASSPRGEERRSDVWWRGVREGRRARRGEGTGEALEECVRGARDAPAGSDRAQEQEDATVRGSGRSPGQQELEAGVVTG